VGNEKQITDGKWEVSSIVGFHEGRSIAELVHTCSESGWIYFYGKQHGPENQFLYR
jgi:hypothetical protein